MFRLSNQGKIPAPNAFLGSGLALRLGCQHFDHTLVLRRCLQQLRSDGDELFDLLLAQCKGSRHIQVIARFFAGDLTGLLEIDLDHIRIDIGCKRNRLGGLRTLLGKQRNASLVVLLGLQRV